MPDWKPVREGDRIRHSVRDDNKLRQRAFRPMPVSSYSSGIQTPNLKALNLEPPYREYEVEITNLKANNDDTDNSARYLCRIRFWDSIVESWKSQEKEWKLDCLDLGNQLFVGARIIARWDEQRGAFVPVEPGIGAAMLLETLERCGTATAKVLNPFCDELQTITVKDFIDILAGDWRDRLLPDTMIYYRPVGYSVLDSGGNLVGNSAGSTGQYEIIAAGGNCCEDQSSSSSSSPSSISSTSSESSPSSTSSESSISTSSISTSSTACGFFTGTKLVRTGCPELIGTVLTEAREEWIYKNGLLCHVNLLDDCELDIGGL